MGKTEVLVVEDDRIAARMVEETFQLEGFKTVVVFDGEQALGKIRSSKPNLVTLDIIMPKVDGWEVLRQMRANPETRNVSVIVVSAKVEEKCRVLGLRQGADDYVTKPFSPTELAARAHAILKQARQVPEKDGSKVELGLIPARRGGGFYLLDVESVFYFDVKYGYACAHTYSEELSTSFSLTEIEKRLDNDYFFRAHRGGIVNLKHVKELKPITKGSYLLVLKDEKETKVVVSRRRVGALRELLGL